MSERKRVEAVEAVDALPQSLEVLLLDAKFVDGVVHRHQVARLHALQVRPNQRQLACAPHQVHDARVVEARLEHLEQVCQGVRVLVEVEVQRLVVQLVVRNLHHDVLERDVLPCRRAVLHHHVRGVVVLVVRHVQVRERLPVPLLLARPDKLGDVQLVGEQLQMLHELLLLVARVQDAELRVDSHVSTLESKSRLHQRQQLVKLARTLVVLAHLLELVSLHDDAQTAELREAELALVHAREAHLLPCLGAVRLACGIHSRLELVKLDESAREATPVGHRLVQQLRRLEQALVEAPVSHAGDVRGVRAADELLQRSMLVRVGEAVRELRVHVALLHALLANHLQVLHHVVVAARTACRGNHLRGCRVVVRADVAGNGVGNGVRKKLRGSKLAPHLWLIHLGGKLVSTLDRLDILEQHLHRELVQLELAVNGERLLVQLAAHGNLSHRRTVERVEAVDVVHDARLVRLDGGENEQVLQVRIPAEGAVLQHNLLQKLNQLVRQLRRHESFDRDAHLLRVLRLRKRGGHHLVNQLAAELVLRIEHERPQLRVHALHHVAALELEQAVAVRHVHELLVALATLVSDARQRGIALLAVLANDAAVVVRVGGKEVLGIVVRVDRDLAKRVVHVRVGGSLLHELLQKSAEQLEAVALLHLVAQRLDGQKTANGQDEVGDEALVALAVEKRTDDHGCICGVHLLHVPLDVAHHAVVVQVLGEVRDESEAIAHVDQRARVRQLRLHQEHLRLLRVEHARLARHALNLLHLPRLGCRLDVLEVHVGVLAGVDQAAEVEVQALVVLELLEQRDDLLRANLLGVLLAHVHDELQILASVHLHQLAQALERPLGRQAAKILQKRLRVHGVRVDDDALDVAEVGVVLQSTHVQPSLLAKLRDARAIVVREHAVGQDGVRDVGERDEVDLEHLRLQHGVLRKIRLQHVEQEARRLADHVALQEEVGDGVVVERRRRHVRNLDGEIHGALRVIHHHALQQEQVVGLLSALLAVSDERVDVALLRHASERLLRRAALRVDLLRHVGVAGSLDHVPELLRRLELVLPEPRVEQLLLVLREHEPRELDRLKGVQRTLRQQRAKVLQQRARLTLRRLHLLESANRLARAQRSLRRLSRHFRRLLVLPHGHELLKLLRDERLCAGQVSAPCHRHGKVEVLQLRGDERNHGLRVHRALDHLPAAIDGQEPARRRRVAAREDGIAGDAVAVHG
mmetsp:Transcript_5001/g.13054  ORF Transcript_5001/g.13054 Transcript_5001/m.13054 type:complete len:1209 (-) Transcript_5001:895-4521(-)